MIAVALVFAAAGLAALYAVAPVLAVVLAFVVGLGGGFAAGRRA